MVAAEDVSYGAGAGLARARPAPLAAGCGGACWGTRGVAPHAKMLLSFFCSAARGVFARGVLKRSKSAVDGLTREPGWGRMGGCSVSLFIFSGNVFFRSFEGMKSLSAVAVRPSNIFRVRGIGAFFRADG